MTELRKLIEAATAFPWALGVNDIDYDVWVDGESGPVLTTRAETPQQRLADAALILYLANHAEDIAALIEATQAWSKAHSSNTEYGPDRDLRTALLPFEAKP